MIAVKFDETAENLELNKAVHAMRLEKNTNPTYGFDVTYDKAKLLSNPTQLELVNLNRLLMKDIHSAHSAKDDFEGYLLRNLKEAKEIAQKRLVEGGADDGHGDHDNGHH